MMYLLFFVFFSQKNAFVYQPHTVCGERSGSSSEAVCATFGRFCYVSIFGLLVFNYVSICGDLIDPVVPTLRVQVGMLRRHGFA